MPDILHRISISAPPERVRDAVVTTAGLRSWWTDDADARDTVGQVNHFGFAGGAVEFPFRIDEMGGARVAWTCLDGPKVPAEWVGTRLTFDLEPQGSGTLLRFAHRGWRSVEGDLPQCNTVWGELMHRLKASAEGRPRGPYVVD